MCVGVSLLVVCHNIGLMGEWYILMGVVECLAPGVVGLIGVAVGDGVGSLAGVAHCVFWWSSDVEGEGDGSTAEAIHDEWSLIPGEVVLSVRVLSACVSQKSFP